MQDRIYRAIMPMGSLGRVSGDVKEASARDRVEAAVELIHSKPEKYGVLVARRVLAMRDGPQKMGAVEKLAPVFGKLPVPIQRRLAGEAESVLYNTHARSPTKSELIDSHKFLTIVHDYLPDYQKERHEAFSEDIKTSFKFNPKFGEKAIESLLDESAEILRARSLSDGLRSFSNHEDVFRYTELDINRIKYENSPKTGKDISSDDVHLLRDCAYDLRRIESDNRNNSDRSNSVHVTSPVSIMKTPPISNRLDVLQERMFDMAIPVGGIHPSSNDMTSATATDRVQVAVELALANPKKYAERLVRGVMKMPYEPDKMKAISELSRIIGHVSEDTRNHLLLEANRTLSLSRSENEIGHYLKFVRRSEKHFSEKYFDFSSSKERVSNVDMIQGIEIKAKKEFIGEKDARSEQRKSSDEFVAGHTKNSLVDYLSTQVELCNKTNLTKYDASLLIRCAYEARKAQTLPEEVHVRDGHSSDRSPNDSGYGTVSPQCSVDAPQKSVHFVDPVDTSAAVRGLHIRNRSAVRG